MNSSRVNVIIPGKLLNESQNLVKSGYFNNFSELVRESLRTELMKYKTSFSEITEEDRKLLALVKQAKASGKLVTEREAERHGLKF